MGEGWWIGPVVAAGNGGGGVSLYGEVQCIKDNGHMVSPIPSANRQDN